MLVTYREDDSRCSIPGFAIKEQSDVFGHKLNLAFEYVKVELSKQYPGHESEVKHEFEAQLNRLAKEGQAHQPVYQGCTPVLIEATGLRQ